jgi:hypothetical protein
MALSSRQARHGTVEQARPGRACPCRQCAALGDPAPPLTRQREGGQYLPGAILQLRLLLSPLPPPLLLLQLLRVPLVKLLQWRQQRQKQQC